MMQERVLIVDDQPNWLSLFSDLLEDEYDVTSMGSYDEAVNALDRDPPFRVAVVDIRLDDKDRLNEDGLRLLEHLKGVASIVVTGYPTVRTAKKALNLGAFDYIEKYPEDAKRFNAENFRQIVRNAMSRFAFVVMPFAEEYKDIYDDAVKRTVETKGLDCKRADDFRDPSWIMDDVRRCIDRAQFLIADLSGRRPNVFYEVGMAHALHKTVILLTQDPDDVPPKLKGIRYIRYEDSAGGKEKLERSLAQTLDGLRQKNFRSRPVFPQEDDLVDPNRCLALITLADPIRIEAYAQIVRQATTECGLTCENIQGIFSTRRTMDAIWKCLNQACVVVADLSGGDADIFYLTGVAHGLRKDVILLAQSEEEIPFDLGEQSYLIYATKPYKKAREAKEGLVQILRKVLEKAASSKTDGGAAGRSMGIPEQHAGSKETSASTTTIDPDASSLTKIKEENSQQYERFAPRLAAYYPQSSHSGEAVERAAAEQYADFTLHIGRDGHARACSEEGERKAEILPSIPDDIGLTLDLVEHNKTSETLLKQFGRRLYQIIFPASIDKHFNQTEAVARRDGRKIRIRLTIEPDVLAQLPWEFMYRGEESYFLATNPATVLSHYLDLPLPQGYIRKRQDPLHILTIISNPKDQPPLNVDRWDQIVRKALSKPLKEGLLTRKTVKQATFEKIRDALLEHPPDIVQFVGHGVYHEGKGYLALVGENGGTWIVDDERFAAIFADVQDRLGLVCLATCESAKSDSPKSFLGIAPRLVQRGTPAVVAMRYPVLVSTAEVFLDNFYTLLVARKPVDWAVQSARNAIAIKVGLDNREFATPVLFMRAKDGSIF